MNIRKVLQSGDVVRFHNSIGMDKQKNSEHEWEVALILQHIYPECSKQLLLAALTHDAAEYYTGDIPFPAKQASPELKSVLDNLERQWEEQNGVHFDLHPEETYFLKLADTLSGMWYCIQQVREGKVNAKRPFRKWREAIAKQLNKWDGNEQQTGKAEEMLELFIREMEEL
jgi:5'-deoxynucleotidase YfbR-like HD superfamily hydrolase